MTSLRSGSASDVGKVRSSNQDVAYESADLFAVADGMGGHVGGEVAARVAVDSLRVAFQRQPSVEGLRRAVAEANRAVWRQSQAESGLRGMGTTLTATALVQETGGRQVVALANVGDSRAYVFSKGQVIQVTADHSLAEEKVRQGQLTQAEAAVHPHRHILTRALGVSSDVDVDLWELHLRDGDRILLCSDGLTNEVGDEQIGEILGSVKGPEEAAKALVQAALDHGGSDNVTCVVIDVSGVAPSTEPVTPGAAGVTGSLEDSGAGHPGAEEANATRTNAVRGDDDRRTDPRATKHAPGSLGGPTRTLRVISGGDRSGSRRQGGTDPSNGANLAGATNAANGANLANGTDGANLAGAANGANLAGGTNGANGASQRSAGGSGGALSAARLQAAELRRLQPTRQDRRRRRRRRPAGVPRLITVRVVLFVIVLLGVV
ncbi:MAG: Stp1/IreP family PP2C-type Ser/Thr phosphatase, partial [Actinomycetota bacterium]|nr:Stp1/IreP family PP2C-type Ser/Thr phosphatase [Actinomycetota bacterium]